MDPELATRILESIGRIRRIICEDSPIGKTILDIKEENIRLRALATRWYLADGTYETHSEEEIIRRRKEAAIQLAELSTFREKAGDMEKLETAILATKFSDDESWAAAVARVMSGYLLEGEIIISPVQRRAEDVEVMAKVFHEAEFQSDYETVSESGKEECRRIARILSYHLLEGKP